MTYTDENGIYHDFRPNALRWGWNGLNFKRLNNKTAEMQGVGIGIKNGHYILLKQSGQDLGYLVEEIEYDSNPKDMFLAKIRIVGEWED